MNLKLNKNINGLMVEPVLDDKTKMYQNDVVNKVLKSFGLVDIDHVTEEIAGKGNKNNLTMPNELSGNERVLKQ